MNLDSAETSPPKSVEAQSGALPPTRLLIVIVNFRTPELTVACLRSLEPEIPSVPGARVVVVENGSADASSQAIGGAIEKHGWSAWATLVISDRNRGFSGGNNLGIAHGEPAEYVLLLNSDTIVHPGCLKRCLQVMESDPRVGAMSCRVLNEDGTIQNVSRKFPTPSRVFVSSLGLPWKLPRWFRWADTEDPEWDRRTTERNVDWLGGAFLFVRSSAVGPAVRLDEDFFFYGEDVEFCHRIRERGFVCRYDPHGSITHLGGASSDPSRLPSDERSLHRWRARYLIQRKCFGPWAAWGIRGLDLATTGLKLLSVRLQGVSPAKRARHLKAQLIRMREPLG